jgi:hypothetical protein
MGIPPCEGLVTRVYDENNQGAHALLKQPPKAPASAAPNGDNCTGFNGLDWADMAD